MQPISGELVELDFSSNRVYVKYRATSDILPMEMVWNVISESIYTEWDLVARSRTIVHKSAQTVRAADKPHAPVVIPHDGPMNRGITPPLLDIVKSANGSRCTVTYDVHPYADFAAQTVHTVYNEPETGLTVYQLEEIFTLPAAERVVAYKVRATGCLPMNENSDLWKRELETDVVKMGDAIMRRSESNMFDTTFEWHP